MPRWEQMVNGTWREADAQIPSASAWTESPAPATPPRVHERAEQITADGHPLPPSGRPEPVERDFEIVLQETRDHVTREEARRIFDANEQDLVNTILEIQDVARPRQAIPPQARPMANPPAAEESLTSPPSAPPAPRAPRTRRRGTVSLDSRGLRDIVVLRGPTGSVPSAPLPGQMNLEAARTLFDFLGLPTAPPRVMRQPLFPSARVPDPVVRPVSETHNLVCEWIDYHEKKDLPDALKAPSQFMCPLSLHAMRDPVMCSDGHMYEHAHIKAWLNKTDSDGCSPLTRQQMSSEMHPCTPIVQMMETWVCSSITVHDGWTLAQAIRAHFGRETDDKDGNLSPEDDSNDGLGPRLADQGTAAFGTDVNVD